MIAQDEPYRAGAARSASTAGTSGSIPAAQKRGAEQMRRRRVLIALGLASLAASSPSLAQAPSRLSTIGMLWTHVPATDPDLDRWRKCFHDMGYEEGRNLHIVVLSAEGIRPAAPVGE
jgi:hypothetical protein